MESTLLLIDGFNLLSRAFFATSYGRTDEQLKNRNGVYTNAVRVFFQKLFNLISEYHVTHLGIAWDVKREETQRRLKYGFYKGTRSELPEALIQQYDTCTTLAESIGIRQRGCKIFCVNSQFPDGSIRLGGHKNDEGFEGVSPAVHQRE